MKGRRCRSKWFTVNEWLVEDEDEDIEVQSTFWLRKGKVVALVLGAWCLVLGAWCVACAASTQANLLGTSDKDRRKTDRHTKEPGQRVQLATSTELVSWKWKWKWCSP